MKLKHSLMGILLAAALVFGASKSKAATSELSTNLNRSNHPIGFYGSILGDPWPSLIGANVGFQALDFARLHAGMSYVPGAIILGGGGKLLVPGWNLSPTVGMGVGVMIGTSDFAGASGSVVYFNAGLDYTASSGFNIGVGVNTGVSDSTDVIPHLTIGYYFDSI